MTRPEVQAPPELYYNIDEAYKYSRASRIVDIQTKLSERAIELLLLPEKSCLVLDIGCGTGISGSVLEDYGHTWIGVDISENMLDMLEIYENESQSTGDAILADIGEILRFRPGVFDGAISISVIQWLCNADKRSHEPYKRLLVFFKWLFNSLNRGSRAIFQFYPESPSQIEMITSAALKSGFGGGLVVDFPNSSKAKKYFLCLWAGFYSSIPQNLPQGLTDENNISESANNMGRSNNKFNKMKKGKKNKHVIKSKSWILEKKNIQRQKGFAVRPDSKYTGRKRKNGF
ncbi:HUSSY like methyltransferase [Cryptosporidium xiaoi]|uniref:HUSSY like methyltransferase n=1 Tax=Cryptosporidium xiaoi TaxID=659607 RepID=A0AAV9XSF0_9CRYT